jgi:hypothetical protein
MFVPKEIDGMCQPMGAIAIKIKDNKGRNIK